MVHQTQITDSNDLHCLKPSNRTHKLSRSDAFFPPSAPTRHRAPSVTETILESRAKCVSTAQKLSVRVIAPPYGQDGNEDVSKGCEKSVAVSEKGNLKENVGRREKTLEDLPTEILGLILDYIFGDIHCVTSTTTSLLSGTTRLSSAMRHPRRKALTDVALVSPTWRELVQERIYRHIKIKGNRAGLIESTEWFSENFQLTKHVRHIEFWVPVWAEKFPEHEKTPFMDMSGGIVPTSSPTSLHGDSSGLATSTGRHLHNQASIHDHRMDETSDDRYRCFTHPFSDGSTSANLSEIFAHIACFFSQAQIFTLEGGHCKKSNMIRQFPTALFPTADRRLVSLPNIRTFAMRGAWNIMREYAHWTTIEKALPGIQDWHCSYAKPRAEAYLTINSILSHIPTKLRHVDISLDGFYCRNGVDGNGGLTLASSSPRSNPAASHHLCERLGMIASQLESLSFTGRICECFFRAAVEAARTRKEVSTLRAVDIIVKSCCRLFVANDAVGDGEGDQQQEGDGDTDNVAETVAGDGDGDGTDNGGVSGPWVNTSHTTVSSNPASLNGTLIPPPTNTTTTQHQYPPTTIPGSITNLHFINAFERLILSAIRSLQPSSSSTPSASSSSSSFCSSPFPSLNHIRIRFIDLDSACPLLNPYFVFDGSPPREPRSARGDTGGRCEGVWNEEILTALSSVRQGAVRWVGLDDLELGERQIHGSEDPGGHESKSALRVDGDTDVDGDAASTPEPLLGGGGGGGVACADSGVSSSSSSSSSIRAPGHGVSASARANAGGRAAAATRRKPRAIKSSTYRVLADPH